MACISFTVVECMCHSVYTLSVRHEVVQSAKFLLVLDFRCSISTTQSNNHGHHRLCGQAVRVEIECLSPPGLLASEKNRTTLYLTNLYNTSISATCNRPKDRTERLREYFNSPTSTEQQNKNMRILSKFYQPFIYSKYKLST